MRKCLLFIKVAGSRSKTLLKLDFFTGELDGRTDILKKNLKAVVQRFSVKKVLLQKFAKFTAKVPMLDSTSLMRTYLFKALLIKIL